MEITIHEEESGGGGGEGMAISHFTFHEKTEKGPIPSHENILYHPLT